MTAGPAETSPVLPVRSSGLPRRQPGGTVILRVLPGTADSAAVARRLMSELLGPDHPALDTAMLLVSELVTNSVTHSRSGVPGGTVTLGLCKGAAGVLIQVGDDGGLTEPCVVRADAIASGGMEHGYGLLLVAALADSWGTTSTLEGRLTWCRIAPSPSRSWQTEAVNQDAVYAPAAGRENSPGRPET